MNIEQLKSESEKLLNELKKISYDEFANFNVRTSFPESLSREFIEWRNNVKKLIQQLPKNFPVADIHSHFHQSDACINPQKSIVSPDDFKSGKDLMLHALGMIIENAKEPIVLPPTTTDASPPGVSMETDKRVGKIFISHYDEQILEDIKTVFETLGELEPGIESGEIEFVARSQGGNLAEIINRIGVIRECTGAVICFPHDDIVTNTENTFVKFDLGACMASFPNKIILLHKGVGDEIPETLLSEVRPFHFVGGLDFRMGMKLAKEILSVLG